MLRQTQSLTVSVSLISPIIDKIWPRVEVWQINHWRPVEPIIYLDVMPIKLR
jgi:hypothetical protein